MIPLTGKSEFLYNEIFKEVKNIIEVSNKNKKEINDKKMLA